MNRASAMRLGGGADLRFTRRLRVARRLALTLVLATLLAVIFLSFWDYNRQQSFEKDQLANFLLTYVLSAIFALWVLLILIRVNSGKVSREVFMAADPERVFALAADPHRWGRGSPRTMRYKTVTVEAAASGGMKGRTMLRTIGIPGDMSWEMLVYKPPRRMVTLARQKSMGIPLAMGLARWSFEPAATGVRVRFEQEYRTIGLRGPVNSLVQRSMDQAADRMLALLKNEAEQTAGKAPSSS